MQDSRATSTLELVVNEQQLQQNMSQIDLTDRTNELTSQTTTTAATQDSRHNLATQSPVTVRNNGNTQRQQINLDHNQHSTTENMFSFVELKQWPNRFRLQMSDKLNEAKAKSETRTQYAFELANAFSGILIWLLCFVFTIIIPILLLFIGLFTFDECPERPSLPYLVFSIGFVMSASNLFNLALALDLPILTNQSLLSIDVKNIIASILNIIFNCIVAFVYILTATKIYAFKTASASTKVLDGDDTLASEITNTSSSEIDCNPTLFNITFWFITLTLGTFVTLTTLGALFLIYNRYRLAIIRGSTPRSQPQTNTNNGNSNLSHTTTINNGTGYAMSPGGGGL